MVNKVETIDDIIVISVVGPQTAETVAAMGRQIKLQLGTLAAEGKPGLVLDDITQLGQTDTQARATVGELAKTLPYERLAMLGNGSTFMRVGTNLLMQAIGMGGKIKYFEDRNKALEWLRGR